MLSLVCSLYPLVSSIYPLVCSLYPLAGWSIYTAPPDTRGVAVTPSVAAFCVCSVSSAV